MIVGHVPDQRRRQAMSARLRQALPAETFIEADYRRYFDDWDVAANTVNIGVSHRFTTVWLAGVSYRRYNQSGASFYAPEYDGAVPQFFTADFRLEPFTSATYTARLQFTPAALWLHPRGTGLTFQYDRYHGNNAFDAAIFTAGLRIPLASR